MKQQPKDTAWPPLGVRDLKPDTKVTPGGRLDALAAALKKAGLLALLAIAACSTPAAFGSELVPIGDGKHDDARSAI